MALPGAADPRGTGDRDPSLVVELVAVRSWLWFGLLVRPARAGRAVSLSRSRRRANGQMVRTRLTRRRIQVTTNSTVLRVANQQSRQGKASSGSGRVAGIAHPCGGRGLALPGAGDGAAARCRPGDPVHGRRVGSGLLPTPPRCASRAALLRDLGQKRPYLGGLHWHVWVVQQAVKLLNLRAYSAQGRVNSLSSLLRTMSSPERGIYPGRS